MYEALGVKNIDLILKKPQPPQPKDPSLEHIDALRVYLFRRLKDKITELILPLTYISWQPIWLKTIL
jgi:hypothetical protein